MNLRCGAVLTTLLLAVFLSPNIQALPRVVITVDVESIPSVPLPEQANLLCLDGSPCGLMHIAKILQERRIGGTFFLNVYEHRRWGEGAMRDIAQSLQTAGQDVALHTHPQWAYDSSRNAMFEYSLEEQVAIVEDGKRLLTNWTGRPVVAHRAGAYTADKHTLDALERSGIRVDSSLFWGHPLSRITGLGLPRNLPSSVGPLIEIPVTVYQREERPRHFGNIFAPVTSIRKIDSDWFLDDDEARAVIDSLIEAKTPYIVIFLHSFSFFEASENGGPPVANRRSEAIFRAMLDHIGGRGLPIVTMSDIAELPLVSELAPPGDIIPRVTVRVGFHRYLWHRWRSSGSPTVPLVLLLATGLFILAVLALYRLRIANARIN
jgi:peptidoglycan/xylan/chitin deacetylase (PgdA/CDA1 family)